MHVDNRHSPHSVLSALPLKATQITSGFWAGRQEINRSASLKTGFKRLEEAGNFHNLRLAAGVADGEFRGPLFMDSDIYKWLEAVGYDLAFHPDDELLEMAREAINLIVVAQAPDGYLDSFYQVAQPQRRWTDLDHGHEMYCAGHLIQAAVAFQRGTGQRKLLDVAIRVADHIDQVFGPGKRQGTCGHPEIEMALVELYRETGEKRYLDLAGFLIDQRGTGKMHGYGIFGPEYHQDRLPVRKAEVVEGHAVRQLYLTSGATDYALETGDLEMMAAMHRLWHDMAARKTHVIGGFGARHHGEAFGEAYELPSDTCYCETCAAIAGFMWNWRMLLATGEERFAGMMERSLYNGILSGVSLDGLKYFYVNPLRTRGDHNRVDWFGCACCPPNLMRLVAMIGNYAFTTTQDAVQVHHYLSCQADLELSAGPVALEMQSGFPHEGSTRLVVKSSPATAWELRLRIPDWCQGAVLKVNAQPVTAPLKPGSYAAVRRVWQPGDLVELVLPMQPFLVAPNPRVDSLRGSLSIQRGPLVYCLEQLDQPSGIDLSDVCLDSSSPLRDEWRSDLLGGVHLIKMDGVLQNSPTWDDALYLPAGQPVLAIKPMTLSAVPYYAWDNRGESPMRVWIPRMDR
jgi:DUF1680 family protein